MASSTPSGDADDELASRRTRRSTRAPDNGPHVARAGVSADQ
jgi:hypothetical protein